MRVILEEGGKYIRDCGGFSEMGSFFVYDCGVNGDSLYMGWRLILRFYV